MHRNVSGWLKDGWDLAKPFWTSSQKNRALIWLSLVVVCALLEVYVAVCLNKWNLAFYNAIQSYDKGVLFSSFPRYTFLLLSYVVTMLGGYYFNSLLEIQWRSWLTNYYLNQWLSSKCYYKERFTHTGFDNPDQRISDDIREFTQLSLNLFLGVFKSLLTLCSFILILWGLSGNFKFHWWSYHFSLPGYLVWTAVLYSLFGSYITFIIGKKLVSISYKQQMYEADFRYNLVRIREYAENIFSYRGEEAEKKIVKRNFDNIINNFMENVKRNLKLNSFNYVYMQLAQIVPSLIAASRYFAREITLGNMMQINSAFGRVEYAIAYFVFAYPQLANWRAVTDRLLGFQMVLQHSTELAKLAVVKTRLPMLEFAKIQLRFADNSLLLNDFSARLDPGDRLLIQGSSGCGKSTLFRAINGLWPYVSGTLYQAEGLTSLLIAQKPYLPRSNLKEAICYPLASNFPSDSQVIEIMLLCGLEKLTRQLYEVEDWSSCLSIGEQQKIAFCRILLNKPNIIYLDEVTSALDIQAELELYSLIIHKLPQSILISIGHRDSLVNLHNKLYNLSSY